MKEQPPGTLVEKTGHDACGSSDALAIYEAEDGSHNGYCWSCGEYVTDPYGVGAAKQTTGTRAMKQDTSYRVPEIFQYPVRDIEHRKLRADIVNYFGVRLGFDSTTGQTLTNIYYPRIKDGVVRGYKDRTVATKDFSSVGNGKGAELFGQQQASATGSRRLFITEGEDDAMALFQALLDANRGTKWEAYLPAVVSLPNGAGSAAKALSEHIGFINSFDDIILVYDNDADGQDAVENSLKILPLDKVTIAKLPLKDSCAMYEAGRHAELVKLVMWKTEKPKIASVATAKEIKREASAPPVWGYSYPWDSLTKLTYGMRNSIIGVGAGVGVGKSSFFHQMQESLIIKQKVKCGLFMLEEPNAVTIKKLAGKQAGIDFTNPTLGFTQAQLDAAIDAIPDDLSIYRHKGTKDWEDVKQAIKHMVLVNGDKAVFVDPLTALVAHLSSSEANDTLNKMFAEIAGMVEDLGFNFIYGAHLNPPKVGPSHEEGGRVTLSQFTGSKAMIKWSHYIFGVERDTQAETEIERNTALIRFLKDRDFGRTGKTLNLHYEELTGRLVESSHIAVAPQAQTQQSNSQVRF